MRKALRPSFRLQNGKRLRLGFKMSALLLLASATAVQATTFVYDNQNDNFSTGFTPTLGTAGGASVSNNTDTILFGGTTYTATDDFGGPININVVTFNNTGTVTLARGSSTAATANTIQLVAVVGAGQQAVINLNNTAGSAGLVTDNLNLNVNSNGSSVTGAGDLNVTGVFGGTASFNKAGSGTVTLSNANNTYSGSLAVQGGTLVVASLGASPLNVSGGGSFVYSPAGASTLTIGTSSSTTSPPSYNTLVSAGAANISNTTAGSTLNLGTISRNGNAQVNFTNTTGTIQVGNANTVTTSATGIIGSFATIGTGANTRYATGAATAGTATAVTPYTGATAAANPAALASSTVTGASTINYDLAAGGSENPNKSAQTIRYTGGTANATFNGVLTTQGILNVGGGTLTINGTGSLAPLNANGYNEVDLNTANGNINVAVPITGGGTVAVVGPGILTLTGVNTNSGNALAQGGSLLFNSPSNGTGNTGNTFVYNGATVLGSGFAPTGNFNVNSGAVLAPGATTVAGTRVAATPGVLTAVGALTLATGSTFNILLNENSSTTGAGAGTTYSQFSTATAPTLTGGNLVLNLGSTLTVGDKFFILLDTGTGTTTTTFANATGSTFTQGIYTFGINYADTGDSTAGNDISLTLNTITPVPEPGTWIGAMLSVGLLGWAQRRNLGSWLRLRRQTPA